MTGLIETAYNVLAIIGALTVFFGLATAGAFVEHWGEKQRAREARKHLRMEKGEQA